VKLATSENSAKPKPVEKYETPERKARASMSSAPETPKLPKNVMILYYFLFQLPF
jgi:hypothetical protein